MALYNVMREHTTISWSSIEADSIDEANELAEIREAEMSWDTASEDKFFVSYAE